MYELVALVAAKEAISENLAAPMRAGWWLDGATGRAFCLDRSSTHSRREAVCSMRR
jgi:hypothetical protein